MYNDGAFYNEYKKVFIKVTDRAEERIDVIRGIGIVQKTVQRMGYLNNRKVISVFVAETTF
jgi:hypothetical protein